MDYKYIDGVQVFVLENKNNKINNKLTKNTVNTWQSDRTEKEKLENTKQGKWAEKALELYIKEYDDFVYIPYDNFRKDNMEYHAPTDGLLYNKYMVSKEIVESFIQKINNEMLNTSSGKYGFLSKKLREEMKNTGVYMVEVKSTQLWPSILTLDEKGAIAQIKKNDDYIIYPKFLKSTNEIENFVDYCNWVKENDKYMSKYSGEELFQKIIEAEKENSRSDIQIRVYTDSTRNKVYLIGYVLKNNIIEKRNIKRFKSKIKKKDTSKNALYYALPIREGRGLNLLFSDYRLWNIANLKVI